MAEKKPKKSKIPKELQAFELGKVRGQFRQLLLANPNYFGNLKESAFEPAIQFPCCNTYYEEIGCVGFQPQFDRLEAVIYVNQNSGYGGSICSPGTQEYVRFFLSDDNGASWQDLGMTNFTVYNIPGEDRIEYASSLSIDPKRRFCFIENILKVRAILSWDDPVPPNQPDWIPIWGDVHDTYIQVEPFQLGSFTDLLKEAKIQLPAQYTQVLDLNHPVPSLEAPVLDLQQRIELYQKKGVEPHRFALKEIKQLVQQPIKSNSLSISAIEGPLAGLEIDWDAIFEALNPTDGSTRYEELECIGLNSAQDTLVGVIRVKLPNGFSGNLCAKGSKEYVTFWADFNDNGTFETCLGTASVEVHDIKKIPKAGLEYAVFLPVNLHPYRRPCTAGPRLVKIRAILSWEEAPPCWNPNYVPVWGNREETTVHIYPGHAPVPNTFNPFLYSINNVGVCSIDQSTGWASGDRPFGGAVLITGEIPAALSLPTPDRLKYKVFVRDLSPLGPWQLLDNSFHVQISEGTGPGTALKYTLKQEIDPSGYYTYREYGSGLGAWRRVSAPNRLLARWNTTSAQTGLWEIKVEALDTLTGITYQAGTSTCLIDGTTRQTVKIRLDQQRPVADLMITGYSRNGGPITPASDCDVFQVGDIIHGRYRATDAPDNHFRRFLLTVEPGSAAGGAKTVPESKSYPVVSGAGEFGTWTLDTSPMKACGYVARLQVWDRTIVSGNSTGWKDEDFVGFCLMDAPSEE